MIQNILLLSVCVWSACGIYVIDKWQHTGYAWYFIAAIACLGIVAGLTYEICMQVSI